MFCNELDMSLDGNARHGVEHEGKHEGRHECRHECRHEGRLECRHQVRVGSNKRLQGRLPPHMSGCDHLILIIANPARVDVRTHARMHARTHTCTHTYAHMCICAHARPPVCVHTRAHSSRSLCLEWFYMHGGHDIFRRDDVESQPCPDFILAALLTEKSTYFIYICLAWCPCRIAARFPPCRTRAACGQRVALVATWVE